MWRTIIKRKMLLFTAIGVLLLALVPLAFPAYWIQMLTQVLIVALYATSLNLEMGHAGMLPLGQSAFYGMGAYTLAILMVKVSLPLWIAALGSLGICLVLNIVIGWLCLRGEAFTFGILHMGFNLLAVLVITKWISVTGGDSGIAGVQRPQLFSDPLPFYFLVLIVVLVGMLMLWVITKSPFGRIGLGLRENEERLRFLGVNTRNYRLTIFVIAGLFSGIAGMLLALLNRGAFPSYISLLASAQAMMMCIIGGMMSFLGPSLGAAVIVVFSNTVSNYTKQWEALLGLIMILVVLGFRGGILRGKHVLLAKKQDTIGVVVKPN